MQKSSRESAVAPGRPPSALSPARATKIASYRPHIRSTTAEVHGTILLLYAVYYSPATLTAVLVHCSTRSVHTSKLALFRPLTRWNSMGFGNFLRAAEICFSAFCAHKPNPGRSSGQRSGASVNWDSPQHLEKVRDRMARAAMCRTLSSILDGLPSA